VDKDVNGRKDPILVLISVASAKLSYILDSRWDERSQCFFY